MYHCVVRMLCGCFMCMYVYPEYDYIRKYVLICSTYSITSTWACVVYVHIYVCMFVCTYVCYVHTHVCMHVCTYVHMYACTHICTLHHPQSSATHGFKRNRGGGGGGLSLHKRMAYYRFSEVTCNPGNLEV